MTIKNLAGTTFDELLDCFLQSFENYFVKMPLDRAYYQERWKMAKVDFQLSYGVFENNKLVGFIINAIDQRNGKMTAYNAGTGVQPAYRGNKYVKAIYDYAIPDLKENGITHCSLEVITGNQPAIKAYQNIGFSVEKNYKCYHGKINLCKSESLILRQIPGNQVDWQALPKQEYYSWENQQASIESGNFKYYMLIHDDQPESYFVINPATGYVPQFDLFDGHHKSWDRLFQGIQQVSANVKINNIDERLESKINYVESIGLTNHIDQFEMHLNLV